MPISAYPTLWVGAVAGLLLHLARVHALQLVSHHTGVWRQEHIIVSRLFAQELYVAKSYPELYIHIYTCPTQRNKKNMYATTNTMKRQRILLLIIPNGNKCTGDSTVFLEKSCLGFHIRAGWIFFYYVASEVIFL